MHLQTKHLQKKKSNAFSRQPCAKYWGNWDGWDLLSVKAGNWAFWPLMLAGCYPPWDLPPSLWVLSLITTTTTRQTSRGAAPYPVLMSWVGTTQNASSEWLCSGKPDKHNLCHVIKVNNHSNESCWSNVPLIWYDENSTLSVRSWSKELWTPV